MPRRDDSNETPVFRVPTFGDISDQLDQDRKLGPLSVTYDIGISKNTYHILDVKKNAKGEYIFRVDRDLVSFSGRRVTEKADYVKIMPHV